MELAMVLLVVAAFLIFFKVLGLIFKAGFFILSIPFQIVGALFCAALVVMLIPFALVAGLLTAVMGSFLVFGPLVPLALVLLGFYLILRR